VGVMRGIVRCVGNVASVLCVVSLGMRRFVMSHICVVIMRGIARCVVIMREIVRCVVIMREIVRCVGYVAYILCVVSLGMSHYDESH
jgi:hypothetical protein